MKTEDWERDLTGKLAVFVDTWKGFTGTEQAGAQPFMGSLLEIYGASFKPGTVFEQHPINVLAAPGKAKAKASRQAALFGMDDAPVYTTERMDRYLPKVCVWEMKAPSEKDLGKHHDQLLRYWARMRTRHLVRCNFHEFWVYDTDEDGGQLEPMLEFSLHELPSRGDALLFLRGDAPDLSTRSERITAEVAASLGRLTRELGHAAGDAPRDRERIAKFILECVFAMFAEDTELVPPKMFTNVLRDAADAGRMDAVWSLPDDFARRDALDKGNRFAPLRERPALRPEAPEDPPDGRAEPRRSGSCST